jgi:hypothetical protein
MSGLESKLRALDNAGAGYLFIDTAPSVGAVNAELFAAADLILIPLNPTPADLRALVKGLPLIKQSGTPFNPPYAARQVRQSRSPCVQGATGVPQAVQATGRHRRPQTQRIALRRTGRLGEARRGEKIEF